jgi:arginine N-succinyltransferase
MWVVRPVIEDDLEALLDLAQSLGSGMTTFPADRATLARKIETASASFAGQLPAKDAAYLMALEDSESKEVLGVSAVYPSIGRPFGFFSYHLDRLILHSPQMDSGLDCAILNLSNIYSGATEIGTLAVRPKARQFGIGKILARARYMLIATFPDLFAKNVIAEMRGWQNEAGDSPFWSAVGERFFKMDFAAADSVSAIKGAEWIANLMPKFPIYLDLLPAEAQAAVGRAHETSAIAMAMLIQEGFRFENYVDVFDAGPQVVAEAHKIKTISESRLCTASPTLSSQAPSQSRLVCNTDLANFRLTVCDTVLEDTDLMTAGKLALEPHVFGLLKCDHGDNVRCVI